VSHAAEYMSTLDRFMIEVMSDVGKAVLLFAISVLSSIRGVLINCLECFSVFGARMIVEAIEQIGSFWRAVDQPPNGRRCLR
jgi:hypothetical protein